MSIRSDRGKAGEEYVCKYLEERGWTILARNYRVRGGEIDIIARNGGIVTFVEVKTRKFGSLDKPSDAVDKRKQRLIIRTADRYFEDNPTDCETVRFDVAEVIVTTEEFPRVIEINYIEDAFDAFVN